MYTWHHIRRNYHEELIESCIDSNLKAKLHNKLNYHTEKLTELNGWVEVGSGGQVPRPTSSCTGHNDY